MKPPEITSPAAKGTAAGTSGVGSSTGSFTGAATKTALETEAKFTSDIALKIYSEGEADAEVETTAPGYVAGSEIEQIKSDLEKRRKMFLVTALEGARAASIEGNELCIEFAPDTRHLRDTLSKSENVKILREVCKELTSRDLGVRSTS